MPIRNQTHTVTRVDTTGNSISSDGTVVTGTTTTFEIKCNVQPESKVLWEDVPSLRGYAEVYRVYSDVELFNADEAKQREADTVEIKEKQFEVVTCNHYPESLIPHYKSYVAF